MDDDDDDDNELMMIMMMMMTMIAQVKSYFKNSSIRSSADSQISPSVTRDMFPSACRLCFIPRYLNAWNRFNSIQMLYFSYVEPYLSELVSSADLI